MRFDRLEEGMAVEKLREVVNANPFVPFSMRLADGRTIPVVHPDYIAFSQSGRIVCAFHGPNDASTFVDVVLVTALEMGPGSAQTQAG